MTDGMLIKELIQDRDLLSYSVVVLDDVHERSLNTDVLLGILKALVEHRKNTELPLKVILMSAPFGTQKLKSYFNDKAPLISIPSRNHEVEIFYSRK